MDTAECLKRVRERNPLVHHITNYVTVNDCANACLAVGGSPVMADALEEAADMSGISDALVLNIGTLNADKVKAMILAGKAANKKGIPVIFDPVGCGATSFRNRMAEELLKQVHMAVIRGNVSEIQSLAGKDAQTKGVDAGTTSGLDEAAATAKALALRAAQRILLRTGIRPFSLRTDALKWLRSQDPGACARRLSAHSVLHVLRIFSMPQKRP